MTGQKVSKSHIRLSADYFSKKSTKDKTTSKRSFPGKNERICQPTDKCLPLLCIKMILHLLKMRELLIS